MFEHIHFSTKKRNIPYDETDVLTDKDYSNFADKYPDLTSMDSHYVIDGKNRFLLSRPTQVRREAVIYMQSFSYGIMGKNYYTERKNYPSYLLFFTYRGEGLLRYNEKEYSLKQGDVFFIDCKKYHYYCSIGDEWEHSDLHLQGLFVDQFYEEYQIDQHPVFHFSNINLYQNILEKSLRIQTGNDIHWVTRASHEFENLLFLLVEQDPSISEYVQPPENIVLLRTYLEHNFQQDLSLEQMSSFSGISKYHLCREFKRFIGFSPREYIIRLRVSQAQLLLQGTNIASYKIGILCGFENEANFIRQFKKHTGMSPGKYRENLTESSCSETVNF